jgi:hypothetical protein
VSQRRFGGDAGRGSAREPATALHEIGLIREQRHEDARQFVGLVLVVAREDRDEFDPPPLGLEQARADPGADALIVLGDGSRPSPGGTRLVRGVIVRVVVHDDHRGGPTPRDLAYDIADLAVLIPRGDDDRDTTRVDEGETFRGGLESGGMGRGHGARS